MLISSSLLDDGIADAADFFDTTLRLSPAMAARLRIAEMPCLRLPISCRSPAGDAAISFVIMVFAITPRRHISHAYCYLISSDTPAAARRCR